MLRLYDYFESGNAYKVRLLLAQLGIPFERVELDILKGETRTPAFLAKNPNHRIPLLEWPDGRTLAESNAILFHLAEGTTFLPFAVIQHADGRIERILGPTGDELDALDTPELQGDPARALSLLERRVESEAKAKGDFQVVGVFSDDDVKLPDGRKSDAIQAEMEHVSGYCANVFLPYGRVENTLSYGEQISAAGQGLVFRCQ